MLAELKVKAESYKKAIRAYEKSPETTQRKISK